MSSMNLSQYMEQLKRAQELPIQQMTPAYDPQKLASDLQSAQTGLQLPQMGAQFGQPVGDERMKLTDTDLSGPMKDTGTGIPADVAKAGISAVGGTIQALAQSAFLEEEGRKKTAAEAETVRAKGKAKAEAQTGAQQFSGLANLMDVYRGVYGGRK